MMKRMVILVTALALILVVLGCSSTRQNTAVSRYTFNFEGKMYVIESMTPETTEGYNILIHRADNRLVFRAIDKEQDGSLDEIMKGGISLDEADRIYNAGIAQGRAKGQVKKRDFTRVYRTSDMMNDYVLKTYLLAVGEEYNMLSILRKETNSQPIVVFDKGADGTINESENKDMDLSIYQRLYNRVLDKGMLDGRITRERGRFLVSL